jgi:hypothetical protein
MADVAHDTIPCPAPESGEYGIVQINVVLGEVPQASRYVRSVVDELHGILAGLRCADHEAAPAVTLSFGQEDDATIAVVPHDCCQQLNRLVAHALEGSPIFRLIGPG